jgi:hypothetical protein
MNGKKTPTNSDIAVRVIMILLGFALLFGLCKILPSLVFIG